MFGLLARIIQLQISSVKEVSDVQPYSSYKFRFGVNRRFLLLIYKTWVAYTVEKKGYS